MQFVHAHGAKIPAIGLGTWTLSGKKGVESIVAAIRAGYRHIDTAAIYGNEEEVGEAIRASGAPRAEIFLTTKVWHTDLADGPFQRSVEASLKRLDADHADLVLIHWPPKSSRMPEAIRALGDVKRRGLARHVGVSNFTSAQIEEAVALSREPIVCNQVEYHPWLGQDKVLAACRKHGVALVSHTPLGRAQFLNGETVVAGIAKSHGKTPAQIILRWHVQQGVAAIPRSSSQERIASNARVFDFALSGPEMAALHALSARNRRFCDFAFSPKWDKA